MAREYPRIGSAGARPKWLKVPANAPFCIAPGCKCRATNRPEIEVSWFRGDDERAGPVCKEHSRAEPVTLLLWTAAWKASQQKPASGVPAVEAPSKPSKCPRCLGERVIDQTGYGEYRPCPECNPESPYYEPPASGVAGGQEQTFPHHTPTPPGAPDT